MPANDEFAKNNLPLIGGVLAAVGASLCCIGPFVLLTLGNELGTGLIRGRFSGAKEDDEKQRLKDSKTLR